MEAAVALVLAGFSARAAWEQSGEPGGLGAAAGLMDDALDGGVSGAGCGGSTATGAAGADATTERQNGRAGLTQG